MPGASTRAGPDPTPQWPETGPIGTRVIYGGPYPRTWGVGTTAWHSALL